MAQSENAKSASEVSQPTPRKFWMRWRVRLGYPVAILYWVFATPTRHSITYGAIVAAFGLIVRAEAAGYLRKDRELAVTGPYARTRNPLYLGSAILAAAFVVAGHSPAAGALVGTYFATFYLAVMRNEEEDLRARFGRDFEEYAARVPLFFPRAYGGGERKVAEIREAQGDAGFSWAQYRRNREYRSLVGTIGALGMVWLRMWLRARYGF
jgi:phospholipid methyltransferase